MGFVPPSHGYIEAYMSISEYSFLYAPENQKILIYVNSAFCCLVIDFAPTKHKLTVMVYNNNE